jgi:uncharacterized membrane protein YhaH (DUF805 family)
MPNRDPLPSRLILEALGRLGECMNPFDFSGRIGRWYFVSRYFLWVFLVSGVVAAVASIDPNPEGRVVGMAATLGSWFLGLVAASLGIRRLHDMNTTGWWYLLAFIPGINLILVLVLLFAPPREPNRYGIRTTDAPPAPEQHAG